MILYIKLTTIFVSFFLYYNTNLLIDKADEIELSDSISSVFQQSTSSFHTSGDTFYFTSGNTVTSYDLTTGNQKFVNDLTGEGPFELENLYDISSDNRSENVSVLSYNGNVLDFDKNGDPNHEFRIESVRNKSILQVDTNYVVVNESPASDHYASVFDQNGNIVRNLDISQENENILLSAFKNGGTLQTVQDEIWITSSYGSEVIVFDSSTFELKNRIKLDIPDFLSTPAEEDLPVYFQDMDKMNDFFQSNSIILNVYPFGEDFLIEVMHMHNQFRKDLVLMDQDLNYRCHSTMPSSLDGVEDPTTVFAKNELIYFYREEIHHDDNDRIRKFLSGYSVSCD